MNSSDRDSLPVIVGVGQAVEHWDGRGVAPSPVSLACTALEAAFADTGGQVREFVDELQVVRLMQDSLPGAVTDQTAFDDYPASVAEQTRLATDAVFYSAVGGDQPQVLLHEACAKVADGECRMIALAGAEAMAAVKLAHRHGQSLDWPLHTERRSTDRGWGAPIINRYELQHGLGLPMFSYALVEHALRARHGWSLDEYHDRVSVIWSAMSHAAADNDFAFFPESKSANFLRTPSPDNPLIVDPYRKWYMAQDAVNQGAAVLVTTVGTARTLGIDPSRQVFLHAYAEALDVPLAERADLSHSAAMRFVIDTVLERAALTIDEIDAMDLYSCFPSAVLLATEYLGIDPMARALTRTGGLPFFGGPGNNYAMHAIATMVDHCRRAPQTRNLLLANGGYFSKLAAAIYSAEPPASPSLEPPEPFVARDCIANAPVASGAPVESFWVGYDRSGPNRAMIASRDGTHRQLLAIEDPRQIAALCREDPVGQPIARWL